MSRPEESSDQRAGRSVPCPRSAFTIVLVRIFGYPLPSKHRWL
jgi:hypothetical protein